MRTLLGAAAAITAILTGSPATAATTPAPRFHGAQYDSPGPDTRGADSLNAEWITLVNDGPAAVRLTGWTVRDAQGKVYTFGEVSLAAKGGRITLHTGRGADDAGHRHWSSGNHIWNNTGDTATLRDPAGRAVDTCSWTARTGRTWVGC